MTCRVGVFAAAAAAVSLGVVPVPGSLGPIPVARAQVAVRVLRLDGAGAVRVDGDLRDWRRLGVPMLEVPPATTGQAGDGSFRYGLAHDGEHLYLAAQIEDARIVRGDAPNRNRDDALVWSFLVPDSGRRQARRPELWVFPGQPGRRRSEIRRTASTGDAVPLERIPGARVVEGPRRDGRPGVAIEAVVPVNRLDPSWTDAQLSVRYQDVDREARPEVRAVVTSTPGPANTWPRLRVVGSDSEVLRGFLRSRGIEAAPRRFDLAGDVTGDGKAERVVVVDRFLLVFGPDYRDGRGFDFITIPVAGGQEVTEARLEDLTGDQVPEVVLGYRVRDGGTTSEVLRVLDPEPGEVRSLVAFEVARRFADGDVIASPVRVERPPRSRRPRRGDDGAPAPTLVVRAADGDLDETSPPRLAPDIHPVLVARWSGVRERRYRYGGEGFAMVAETPAPAPAARAAAQAPTSRPAAEAPAASPAPSRAYDAASLLDEARRRAGIPPGARPRHRLRRDLSGDRTPEDAMVIGTHLVVIGPAFREGRGFALLPLPVDRDEAVLDVSTADLTGDGTDELLIRIRRTNGDVSRDVLLVHRLTEDAFPRLAALEVRRARGGDFVENQVRLRGRGRRATLERRPGRARGFAEGSWPFAADPPGTTPEPILLPWRDRAVRYRFDGDRLVQR